MHLIDAKFPAKLKLILNKFLIILVLAYFCRINQEYADFRKI